jgi:hypothetical protein
MERIDSFEQAYRKLINLAVEDSEKWGHDRIDTVNLLNVMVSTEDDPVYRLISNITAIESFKSGLEKKLRSYSGEIPKVPPKLSKDSEFDKYLDQFLTPDAIDSYHLAGWRFVYDNKKPKLDPKIYFLQGIIDNGNNSVSKLLRENNITINTIQGYSRR